MKDEEPAAMARPEGSAAPRATGGSTSGTQRLAIVSAAAALSAWALDTAGATVAVPVIQTDLEISITASQWILNLAFLALAGLVTLGGWLGDRQGRTRIFALGLLVFIAAEAMAFGAGLAGATTILFVGRFVAGAGAALFVPAGTALLIDVFPPDQRGSATGRAFSLTMLVTAAGPILAGILVQSVGWPWVFVPGLALALLALVTVTRIHLPARQAQRDAPRLDIVGAVLLFVAVATLIDGFMQAGADGLTAPSVLGALGFGALLAVAWIVWELRSRAPLVDPRVVRNRAVLIALIVVFMRFLPSTLGGAFLARYVQQVLDFSPSLTGIAMLPATVTTFLVAGAAGKVLDRMGIRPPVAVAMGCLAGSAALYAVGYGNESYAVLAIGLVAGGVGLAFSNNVQPYAIGSVDARKRGAIAGMMPLAGQFATAMWLAVLTAGLVAIGGTEDAASAQTTALPVMAWAATIALVVAGLVVLALAPRPRPAPDPADVREARTPTPEPGQSKKDGR